MYCIHIAWQYVLETSQINVVVFYEIRQIIVSKGK